MMQLPVVERLVKKNHRLRKQNRKLVRLLIEKLDTRDASEIASLPETPNIHYELFEVVTQTAEDAEEENEAEEEEEEAEEEEEEEEAVEEEEEEEVQEEEAEEEEEAVEAESEESDELEVFEVTIRGKKYFTTNATNGDIYAMDSDGEVGDKIGQFVNGKAQL